MESRYLLINFSHLHLRSLREITDNYLSLHWQGRFYFSNAYNTSDAVQYSITLNHNLVLQFEEDAQYSLTLQSWENHMIMFQHQVDISELKTRAATRKKVEIRQGQILDLTIHILQPNEFHLSKEYSRDIIQHFALIHNMTLNDYDTAVDHGPSYIAVQHDAGTIFVPVVNAVAVVSLPSRLRFKHYKNGRVRSVSRFYQCEEVIETGKVRMIAGEDAGYDLEIGLLWGINLWHNLPERSILLDAQEILIYEIEVRLQAWKEMPSGAKIRINYANKSFELNGESEATVLRFGRIVYFVMKSQEEDFSVIIEKNMKILAKAVIGSEQLLSYHLNTLKKKLLDPNGKHMASIRFKCQKAKSLSLPHSNPLWKNSNLKSKQPSVVLEFSQLSMQWQKDEPCGLVIKTEEQEVFVPQLTNLDYFQLQIEIPEPVIITLHQQCNIYLKVVNSQNKDEFLGIAVLNFGDLRLGINVLTLPFFKQQVASCLLHLIVNKVVSWPFIRATNVPQGISGLSLHMIGISVQIKRIQLTGYYYSYQYDRKKEIYCIVEINRIKKVLILEQFNTMTKALLFVNSAGSDILNFTVDHNESARVRLTLLVGDEGVQEEVYGVLQKRIRVEDLKDGPVRFEAQEIANDHGIAVGVIDFEVQSGLSGDYRKPIKKDLKNVQNSLDKVNKSIAKVERSISKKQVALPQGKKRYESLKLPEIKDPRQERLKRLAKMLQMKEKQNEKKRAERGRRVESQRRAEIIRDSSAIVNYTSIERPPEEIRESQVIQSKLQLQEQAKPQETPEDFNQSKPLDFPQQLNDNEFLNTPKT